MSDKSAEQVLEAVRSEATKYGRCCDFYQDGLGQFHCSDCGQRTFSMLHGVQLILGGTKDVPVMSHEEAREAATLRAAAPDMAAALDSALELVAKVVAGEITADDFNTGVLASYRDEFEMALAKARGKP